MLRLACHGRRASGRCVRLIRVFVVAAVRLYEEGLAQVLRADERFEVVATAPRTDQALARIHDLVEPPQVVLLDVGLEDGVEGLHSIHDEFPGVEVVALSVREVEEDVIAWAEAGVAGFVARDASIADLKATLESVGRGETLCSPQVAATLLRRVAALSRERGAGAQLQPALTARELEIAALIDEGLSNKEIAGRLRIELSTVKNHVHNILEKLQVRRRSEAVAVLRDARLSGSRSGSGS